MRYQPLWVIVLISLIHSSCFALELPSLPFLGKREITNIELKGNKVLLNLLEQELQKQRKENLQLQQYTKLGKISRLERQLLNERLRAEGYYGAEIKVDLRNDRIFYQIDPGQVYRVAQLKIQTPENIGHLHNVIDLKTGQPLRAESVLAAKTTLSNFIADNFCLYHIDVNYRVLIEHQTHSANIIFSVDDSPSVRFGEISFEGLQSVDSDYLLPLLPIKQGECFKPKRIDAARLTLIQSSLLVSANADIGTPNNGLVPITLRVVERHHRRVSAGVGFESDEGFGVSAGWEHRNLMGRAQRLALDAHIAQDAQTLSANLTLPNFHRNDQSVTFYTDIEQEDTDAFKSKRGAVGANFTRQLTRNLRGLIGSELAFSQIEEDGKNEDYALLSLPMNLESDHRNAPLDPRRGWVAAGTVRPFWDAYNTSTKFLKSTLAASAYLSFDQALWRPTLAVRGAAGAISGISRDQVPANIRFYAGGGGSVRGYPYQTLGPLTDNKPDGGLSFTEISAEARLRWGENWGGVIFIDGGFAYEESVPKLGQDLHWGAGAGIRYYTSFAPIRLDIATPLNKRDGIDDNFQLYISIGQAF